MTHHGPEEDFDSWLAQELRARQPYLEDEGFSDRVMHAVPTAPASGRLRPLLWSLFLALSSLLLTLWLFPGWGWLSSLLAAFLTLPLSMLLLIGLGMGLGMAALACLVFWQSGALR